MLKIKIGIIGGSGLDDLDVVQDIKEEQVKTPFGYPSDVLITGTINGVECVFLSRHGKGHLINPTNVNYRANIWALRSVGCTHVIGFSASGSLKEDVKPGDFLVPDSFIDLTKKRDYTFYDGSFYRDKVVHIPMHPAYCDHTRSVLINTLNELDIPFHSTGTAVVIEGPRFSSYAECRLYRRWEADIVNMTIVPEVVLAKELGLCYATLAIITDYDNWHSTDEIVDVQKVLKLMSEVKHKVHLIIPHLIDSIASQNWDEIIEKLKATVAEGHQSKGAD